MAQMQRPTTRHYAERESKLEASMQSFPSEIDTPQGEGRGKIVGVREDGGQEKNVAPGAN